MPLQDQLNRPMVTPSDFVLLGGWKGNSGGAGTGFDNDMGTGSMLVEHGSGSTRYITMCGKANSITAHRFSVSLSNMGTNPADRVNWPVTTPLQHFASISHGDCGAQYVGGITRPNGAVYLTSGRVNYATEPYSWINPWMSWVSASTGLPTGVLNAPGNVDDRSGYGEGFVNIPQWFADAYLGGRNFGVGKGGYRSGQGSCPGPALFVADRPADNQATLTNATPIIRYWWTGALTEEEMRTSRPKRFPDYGTPLWGPSKLNGEGWNQADECWGGWFWVDTPTKQGLCSIMLQGLGDLNYGLQDNTFSIQRRLRLYTYTPQELALAIAGTRAIHQVIPNGYYEWPNPFIEPQDYSYRQWPHAAYYDPVDNYLYLSYQFCGGQQFEITPVICVYSLGAVGPSQPTYSVTPVSSSVTEGNNLTVNVTGSDIVNGTYYWTIGDNQADFVSSSGTVTITSNYGTFTVQPIDDAVAEGIETFTLILRSGSTSGPVLATSFTVTINDTGGSPSSTYTVIPVTLSVNEGSDLMFNVSGTNITNGTYYWTVTNAGDFGTSSGSFSITNNTGNFSVTPTSDTTTEGAETFTASIRSGSISGPVLATSTSVAINDTSLSIYNVAAAGGATSVNEGSSLTFDVTGTNIPDGTYYWTIGMAVADFGTASGSFTITGSVGSFSVTPTLDMMTEGVETFTVAIRTTSISGTVLATSSSITINDTSVAQVSMASGSLRFGL